MACGRLVEALPMKDGEGEFRRALVDDPGPEIEARRLHGAGEARRLAEVRRHDRALRFDDEERVRAAAGDLGAQTEIPIARIAPPALVNADRVHSTAREDFDGACLRIERP